MIPPRRVLLLNPPGEHVYIRDYYCSKISRTGYTFPPVDLLQAGAVFRGRGWEVSAIDAIVQGWDGERVLAEITQLAPDAVFNLIGAVSVEEDAVFLGEMRRRHPGVTLIGSGDVLLEHGVAWVEKGLLDAVALDFASPSPARFAEGEGGALPDLIHRRDGGTVVVGPRGTGKSVGVGLPPHELFRPLPYRFPFARRRPFASLLTDHGCPYRCSFCVMATLHYHARPMDEVAAELRSLQDLGIREFALWDQTFAISKPRALEFLALLPRGRDAFGWTCFTRPDRVDADLASAMAGSGCHTVIMGVETANEQSLQDIRKEFTTDQMRQGFAVCRAAGMETVATVIVGLPGETAADVEATMNFVCRLDPDYLSVHTAIPRAGTALRTQMVEQGLISHDLANMDQSGEVAVVSSNALTADEIVMLRKRFNRRFHLRPRYLARRLLLALGDPARLVEQIRQGLALLGRSA